MKYIHKSGTASELGGKGYGLARLQAEGFLVPEWFTMSPEAFKESLNDRQWRAFERAGYKVTHKIRHRKPRKRTKSNSKS